MSHNRRAAAHSTTQTSLSFVQLGTPLPSLGHQSSGSAYKPLWEQEVLDEQGRRRFHGAFTGGYSAGYFNTVGSKEGWTPSSFVSQRRARGAINTSDAPATSDDDDNTSGNKRRRVEGGAKRQQRVEDFMDEEDKASMSLGVQARTATQHQYAYDPLLGALGGEAAPPPSSSGIAAGPE